MATRPVAQLLQALQFLLRQHLPAQISRLKAQLLTQGTHGRLAVTAEDREGKVPTQAFQRRHYISTQLVFDLTNPSNACHGPPPPRSHRPEQASPCFIAEGNAE